MEITLIVNSIAAVIACLAFVAATEEGKAVPNFHDRAHIQDKDHLQEHLEGVVDMNQDLSDKELEFHYFKSHDTDNNNKLDGIELIAALTHFHKDEQSDPNDIERMEDQELANMIDMMLDDDDVNGDGYIEYSEFLLSQGKPAVENES